MDIFAPKAIEKQKIANIIEKIICLLPPYSLKWIKTFVSDNSGHWLCGQWKICTKSRLLHAAKNPGIFVEKALRLKSRNFPKSLGTRLLKAVVLIEITDRPKILSS